MPSRHRPDRRRRGLVLAGAATATFAALPPLRALAQAAAASPDGPAPGVAAAPEDARPGGPAADPAAPSGPDPRLTERATGRADAPVTVTEFFSLTCSHCAAFHRDTWPEVKRALVDTGQVRMVWRDFPLDRVALLAAAVARSLPPDRYEGFVGTLLSSQDRWAFRPDAVAELKRLAALAGMSGARFDAVQADEALQRAILNGRLDAEKQYQVQATPSFAFARGGRTRTHSGAVGFAEFKRLVDEVRTA